MNSEQLTATLAELVMGWRVAPNRFLIGNRSWLPRWRFQPTKSLNDALRLLVSAAPQEHSMGTTKNGGFWAKVRIAGRTGHASESSQARALTFAIARAIGLNVDAAE
jgi:hypothetical protein